MTLDSPQEARGHPLIKVEGANLNTEKHYLPV